MGVHHYGICFLFKIPAHGGKDDENEGAMKRMDKKIALSKDNADGTASCMYNIRRATPTSFRRKKAPRPFPWGSKG